MEPSPGRIHVFRREDGVWKLIHRHVDPIASVTDPDVLLQETATAGLVYFPRPSSDAFNDAGRDR